MQYHVFAPLILIPLALAHSRRHVTIVVVTVIVLLLANIITIAAIVLQHPGLELGETGPQSDLHFAIIYIAPW